MCKPSLPDERDTVVRAELRTILQRDAPTVWSAADLDAVVDKLMARWRCLLDELESAVMYGYPSNAPPVGFLQSTRPTAAARWVNRITFTPDPRDVWLLNRSFEAFAYEVERRTSRATLTRGRPWLAL